MPDQDVDTPTEAPVAPEAATSRELLTLDELTARVGMSVRNVRFYTTKGLVPPPIRRGRSGYYTAEHVARLELVQELQAHGFTLAAIEKYVSAIPADASAEEIAMQRTMRAPWMADRPVRLTRAELSSRAGRELSDSELSTLEEMEIVHPCDDGTYEVALTQFSVGLGLLEIGYPPEAARAGRELYARHGKELAEELLAVFRTQVWPAYKEAGMTRERLTEVVERIKPLSITSLVSAYETAMDEATRADIVNRGR